LRSYILHQEQSKVISELLIGELESLDSDDDPNVLFKLKVFRFATAVFSGKRSKAEDLEFWNRVKEKVERLLVVRMAKTILENARLLDWSERMNSTAGHSLASVVDFMLTEGVDVAAEFGQLSRPLCPLCNAESFQSASIAEHVCANNHRLPACSLSFLPIPSFSYRKCSRCDLPALDRNKMSELKELIPEIDYCPYCDGELATPSGGLR